MTDDPTRRTPSDFRPRSIAQELTVKRLVKTGGFTPPLSNDGPHYRALVEVLHSFDGTPHERFVWDIYFNWSRVRDCDRRDVKEAATEAGLTFEEFVCRRTLDEVRFQLRLKGIDEPKSNTNSEADRKSGQPIGVAKSEFVVSVIVSATQATITTSKSEETIELPSDGVARWLKVLTDHPMAWFLPADYVEHDKELDGIKTTDRQRSLKTWKKGKCSKLAKLIEPSKRNGMRFNPSLAQKQRRAPQCANN